MITRSALLAIALTLAVPPIAQADGTRAVQARSFDLGTLSGLTYFTPEADGYRVVVTLPRRDSGPAIRFETTLAPGQNSVISIPQELGAEAQAIEIVRTGDEVSVRKAVRKTASID